MNISIIVPSYKRPESLDKLLGSIVKQDINVETIVVDDGNDKITKDTVQGYEPVKYVCGSGEGPTKARLLGIEASSGEVVGFLEDDMVLHGDFFSPLIRLFKGGRNVIQSRIIEEDKNLLEYPVSKYGWNFEYKVNFNAKKPKFINICQESGLFIRSDVLKKVSIHDQRLVGEHGGSILFSFKLLSAGYKIYFNPNSVIYHSKDDAGGRVATTDKTRSAHKDKIHCNDFFREYYYNLMFIHTLYHPFLSLPSLVYHIFKSFLRVVAYREIDCITNLVPPLINGFVSGIDNVFSGGKLN